MIRASASIGIVLSSLIVLGCGEASVHKVHEGALLDNKVLQQRVEVALRSAGRDFQDVHVEADHGTAILSGTVASADARTKAEEISSGVYGVTSTDNALTVKTSSRGR